jgi:hypothetical protein
VNGPGCSEWAAKNDALRGLDDALYAAEGSAADLGSFQVTAATLGEFALASDLSQVRSSRGRAATHLAKLDTEVRAAGFTALVPRHDDARSLFDGCVFRTWERGRPPTGQPDDGVQEVANEVEGAGEEAISATGIASFFSDVGTAARRPIVQGLTRADTFGAFSG